MTFSELIVEGDILAELLVLRGQLAFFNSRLRRKYTQASCFEIKAEKTGFNPSSLMERLSKHMRNFISIREKYVLLSAILQAVINKRPDDRKNNRNKRC